MKRILFLNFYAFSLTGGIEKFNRAFLKGLSDLQEQGKLLAEGRSIYDSKPDTRYFSKEKYKGFQGKRLSFAFDVLRSSYRFDTIILSHIHLSAIALLVKLIFPSKQVILVAHGIEVWGK